MTDAVTTIFVDTNVFVYLRDARDGTKQALAADWLAYLWESRAGRVSAQVLHEYYVTVTTKLKPGLSLEEARKDVLAMHSWRPAPMDQRLLDPAWHVQDRWGCSFWDALIVAAAQAQSCSLLLTEDFSHGRNLDGLRVVNPFRETPDEALSL